MNYFPKVEYLLYEYKTIVAEIENIKLEIEALKNDYKGCVAISYEEKTGQTYKFNSSVENEVILREDEIKKLERQQQSKETQVKQINNALNTLTDTEMQLIKLRYSDKLQFKEIGERLNMNDTYCIEFKRRIINKLIPIIFLRKNLDNA